MILSVLDLLQFFFSYAPEMFLLKNYLMSGFRNYQDMFFRSQLACRISL